MFLDLLFTFYVYLLVFLFCTTVFLIALDLNWGPIPHLYIRILERIQEKFQEAYPEDYFEQLPWRNLIADKKSLSECNDRRVDFEFIEQQIEFPYNTKLNLIRSGIEAIIQDEFSGSFDLAPEHQRHRLSRVLWDFLGNKLHLKALFVFLFSLRVFIIFPVRLCLYLSSFLFITVCCLLTYFVKFSTEQKLFITRRFCRLYTASTGLIAFFHNEQDKPKPPGIIVSNHLTANDVMVIASDVSHKQDWLYTVTGQQHAGIIGSIQMLVSKLCSTMWLERSIADSRLKFLKEVLDAAKRQQLVLMFPEGYCSNGKCVLQFRKAVFEKNIRIHPIAIRQDARFGDAFWYEDWFITHLVRVFSSFATVYHITYLSVQYRWDDETPEQFASRVQNQIAKVSGSRSLEFQGNLFYKAHDREKYKIHLQKMCASEINQLAAETAAIYNMSASASDGP